MRPISLLRHSAIVSCTTLTIACYAWQPLPVEPREALSQSPALARLELQDGRTVTLAHIKIERDTAFGESRPSHKTIREPVADVRRVLVLQPDPRRTHYAIAGVAAAGVGIMAVIMVETFKTPTPTATPIDLCPDLC